MRKFVLSLLTIVVALLVPAMLVVNGIRLVANDWYIHFEYARPGFPPDAYGFTLKQRTELSLAGLHSVLPRYEAGIDLLRQARMPDGQPAFSAYELEHMQDVRILIGRVYALHLVILVAIIGLSIGLSGSPETKMAMPRALRAGAIFTLVLAAGLITYILINFYTFFIQFHEVFFESGTWTFQFTDTLIRLYPLQLWSDVAILLGVGTVVQAALLLAGSWWWLRRVHHAPNF